MKETKPAELRDLSDFEASDSSPVEMVLLEMDKTLGNIGEGLNQLERRLRPVSHEMEDEDEDDGTVRGAPGRSNVVQQLSALVEHAQRHNRRITDMIRALEV